MTSVWIMILVVYTTFGSSAVSVTKAGTYVSEAQCKAAFPKHKEGLGGYCVQAPADLNK